MTDAVHGRRGEAVRLIALVGLRATGKTTLGRELAAQLQWRFVDADELLAAQVGEPAGEHLRRVGEPAFRLAERSVLLPFLAAADRTVLATGGGAVLDQEVRTQLAAPDVFTAWLRTDQRVLQQRLDAPGPVRPALTALPLDRELSLLAERREPWYEAVADLQLNTGELNLRDCVERLVAAVAAAPGRGGAQ